MKDIFSKVLDLLCEDKEMRSCFYSIIESSYDAIIVETLDGKVLDWNKAAEKIYGYNSNEMVGTSIFNIIPEDKKEQFKGILTRIKSGEKIKNFVTERIKKNGDKIFLSSVVTPIRGKNNDIVAVLSIVRDVTDFKSMTMELHESNERLKSSYEKLSALHKELYSAERELREQYNVLKENQKLLEISERRYQLAVEGSNDGIWDMDIKNNRIFVSNRCKELFDVEAEGNVFSISQCESYILKKNCSKIFSKLERYLKKQDSFYSDEIRITTNNGEDKYIYCRGKALWDQNGKAIYIAGSVTDITERKAYERIIENLAYTSEVTGLYNRTYAMNKFPNLLKELEDANANAAFVFVDMDNFKAINETIGHLAGDKFLSKVSKQFKNLLKRNDYACHLGGDKFLFLLTDVKNKAEVEEFAKRILNIFKKPFSLNGQNIYYITASVGITMMQDYGYDMQTLFNYSDDAVYYAKINGKNKYVFYRHKMQSTIYEDTKLLNELKRALHSNEFKVFYQPKIKVDTKEIIGMEALVRWQKEDGTMVPPSQFINFAEEKGIILPIGEYVMKTSCLQNRKWIDKGLKPVRVAVNLSACQLADEKIFYKIKDILKETGLPPSYLEVEITETMIIENFETSIRILNKLKDLGIKISLDDFGTGYSSLSYLKQLPINSVKIDKSFIDNITLDLKERFVANSVINLVHGLGLTVVAEGVEKEEQFQLLKDLGCDEIQGYYFSKPVSLEEFEKMI